MGFRTVVGVAALLLSGPAAADPGMVTGGAARTFGELGYQVRLLSQAWEGDGHVEELPARLLHRGEQATLPLLAKHLDSKTEACVTVAALSATNVTFLLAFGDERLRPDQRAWPVPSAAGVAQVTRCGARKELLDGLHVQLRSRRGVLQFLVLTSAEPPVQADEVLPGRDPGPSRSAPEVGARPALAPLAQRVDRLTARQRRKGGKVRRFSLSSNERGRGERVLHLSPGCYHYSVLAPQAPDAPPDVDARLMNLSTNRVLVTDDEHAGQASLRYCAGGTERVRLEFHGAHPNSEIVLLEGHWALPSGLPAAWGTEARSRLANELFLAERLDLPAPPVDVAMGVRGQSRWSVRVAATGCYVAALAPLRGELAQAQLRIQGANTLSTTRRVEGLRVSTLNFCAERQGLVFVSVETVGTSLAWIAAVWPLEGGSKP